MTDMIDLCKRHGVQIVPVLNNYNATKDDFDPDRMATMLNNPSVRDNHINEIIKLLTDHPEFAGVDVDYENMKATVKDAYSVFMEKLSEAIHAKGKILTTALATKVGPGTWDAPQAQDYKRIGNAVDEMLLMTYDLHWSTSKKPGPISAADWANDVITYAVTQVKDPNKIQMGIPLYGYDWVVNGKTAGVTSLDVENLIKLYHPTINTEPDGGEKYFTYTAGGANHTVYYQDASSITKTLEAFDEYNMGTYIGGVGVWRLGSEDSSLWLALCKKLKPANGKCTTTSINEPVMNLQATLHNEPNPFTTSTNLSFTLASENRVTISVYNILGATVLNISNGIMAKGTHTVMIDLKNRSNGIYFCKISSGNESSVLKIVKQ
jgi:spore germination protein YaaH